LSAPSGGADVTGEQDVEIPPQNKWQGRTCSEKDQGKKQRGKKSAKKFEQITSYLSKGAMVIVSQQFGK
jgi:hypothetical protein